MNANGVFVLTADGALAGHVATALRVHRRWAQTIGLAVPDGLADMEAAFADRARQGQAGTPLADLWTLTDHLPMKPILLTYGDTARALACSVRTVKRLVASGDLPTATIGASPRIRRTDLDAYVDRLESRQTA